MLMKCVVSCSGRRSYSVGKVLVKYMKLSQAHSDNLYSYVSVQPKYVSGRAQDKASEQALDERFNEEIVKKKGKRAPCSTTSRKKVAEEICDYVSESCAGVIIDTLPKKYIKRNRPTYDSLYLVNPSVADTIVQSIKKDIVKRGVIVVETNPGLGILSQKLIDAGVHQLHLHEPQPSCYKSLQEFHVQHYGKVTLHSTDFLFLWKFAYQDKMDQGTRVQDILCHYPMKGWIEEPSLKIIGCIQTPYLIRHLILNIVFQEGIMKHCRPEFYFLVSPLIHSSLTCTGLDGYQRYRSTTVLFQLFFDFELLEKIPRKAYLPWPMKSSRQKYKLDEVTSLNEEEWLYLLKITPKKNLYESVSPDQLPALWYFVKHHFFTRTRKVIQGMESWIPGCGARLILDGYNIFTEFGELNPEQVLQIFQQFSSWPEYEDCSFLSSLESSLLKLGSSEDDIDKSEDNVKEKSVRHKNEGND